MSNCISWSLIVLFSISSLFGQVEKENRYFIYLKQKTTESYPYKLESPKAFLSDKALERRNNQDIAIDSSDLPIDPNIISVLASQDISIYFKSKWLSGVLAEMDSSKVSTLYQLAIVDSIRLVAPGTRLGSELRGHTLPTEFKKPSSNDATTDIQLIMMGADKIVSDNVVENEVTIAVFDNGFKGVDLYKPFEELWQEQRIIATKDFVENSENVFQFGGHGTSVFSIIGANYHAEESSFMGIANKAKFVLCITEDDQGENTIEEYNWLFAAEFADSLGVDIINSSLGYRTFDLPEHNYDFDDLNGHVSIISSAALMAARKGILVVTSAGNNGELKAPSNLISHPADADSILAVGSVDYDFSLSSFSSIGPTTDGRIKPDVCAFGNGTAIVKSDGIIERGGGTSFAAPLIAGFAALIWQTHPDWTAQEVIESIKKSGHNSRNPNNSLGYGVPNYAYISSEERVLKVEDILQDRITIYPNPFKSGKLYLKLVEGFAEDVNIRILDSKGVEVFSKQFFAPNLKEIMSLTLDSVEQGIYYLFLKTENYQKVVKLLNF